MIKGYKNFRAGLIGRRLTHSYSPQIHALLADYDYRLIELEPECVGDFLRHGEFDALNVTIPYKLDVIPYLDGLCGDAVKIGAVNTIKRDGERLYGYNTDGYGFMYLLRHAGIDVHGAKVLVLGSGGASRTAQVMLREAGAHSVVVISRGGEDNYGNISRHADADVIVNATPVGMYPDCAATPVELSVFGRLSGVVDMIYNPCRTTLLCDAQSRGIKNTNGLAMLAAQAKRACEIFLDCDIDCGAAVDIINKVGFETENIILIGMPGSGKTTVGRIIAQKLGRELLDTDAIVEKNTSMSIPDIFAKYGEARFRELESAALVSASAHTGSVIATGGGVVTRDENYQTLHRAGTVVLLERVLSELSRGGRPLSLERGVETIYRERRGSYERFADLRVAVSGGAEATAERVIDGLKNRRNIK